jgi:hypothetical protein
MQTHQDTKLICEDILTPFYNLRAVHGIKIIAELAGDDTDVHQYHDSLTSYRE